MNRASNFRTILTSLAFAAIAFTASASFAEEAKVPTTAADHEALAKQYRDEAAQYKKVSAEHHEMAETYKKQVVMPWAEPVPRPHDQLRARRPSRGA
jgi:hypothetical protein